MGSAYFDAHSLWQLSDKPLLTSIPRDLECDTCIVGAGIAGLTIAYQLIKAGQKVVVLDRERIGLGETGLTSAHLSNALDEHFTQLERWHGQEGAKLAAESHTAAIDLIERIVQSENIDCEFERVDGYLFLSDQKTVKDLHEELKASHRAGLNQVHLLEKAPAFFKSGPCLVYPRQAQFHPLKYLDGLVQAIQRLGGQIFTHSEVQEVKGGYPAKVKTTTGAIVRCDAVVVATDTPFNTNVIFHSKNAPYRTYVVGMKVEKAQVTPALFWDMDSPYHYLRFVKDPHTEEDILLIGGEDHRTGQDVDMEKHFRKLSDWAESRLGVTSRVITRWSGQVMETLDGLAYIGRNPGDVENVYVVTGDSGHGLTHGTIAGLLIPDLMSGRENPWSTLYDPSRLHWRNLGTYAAESVSSALPYGDWLSQGDVESTSEIEAGEGAVLREGLSKVAVYKDEVGRLHSCSAVCPHLGGIVRWNSAEKTWDCPCHGSRFDRFGQVLNGPATQELGPINEPISPDQLTAGI